MTELLKVSKSEGVATVLLNRPEAFNALNAELSDALSASMMSLAADEAVRGVVISGEGKAFCAGGDLKWALACPQGPTSGLHRLVAGFHSVVLEIRRMPKPVIAAINGMAVGGGLSLALACDFRVLADSSMLRLGYPSVGLCPDGGGSFMLPRLIGLAKAMELLAFDRPISSENALAWGLVTKVVERGKALEEAVRMAMEIAGGSLHAFGYSKRLLTDSFNSSFEAHLERERRGLVGCAAHPEGLEGMRAFAEKRKPVFTLGKI